MGGGQAYLVGFNLQKGRGKMGCKLRVYFCTTVLHQAFFLDKIPHYLPTRNWRILEFRAKFLEFFVEILEFFSKPLSFFSKCLSFFLKRLELCNHDGLFSWNLEFYPSFLSFSLNFMSLDRKFTLKYSLLQ